VKKLTLIPLLCAIMLVASPAFAGPVHTKPPVPAVVLVSASDVTLDGASADEFLSLGTLNPQGNQGDAAITAAFGGDWSAVGAYAGDAATTAHGQTPSVLDFEFSLANDKGGSWSVTNTSLTENLTFDLVFAMHAGHAGGAWLFDGVSILAGETLDGAWIQRMLNGGGNAAGFSNVTFFVRAADAIPPIVTVPEPATLGSLMLGLGMLGFMARRRKQS
jgi:hypothetical protein